MGKNNGRHGKRTAYAKYESVMTKLENEVRKQIAEEKKTSNKKKKGNENEPDEERVLN